MSKRSKHTVVARAYNSKGHLLAVAKNSYVKTHRLQAEYSRRVGKESAIYLHAEIYALLKAREPVYRMEILRVNADGTPALAAPCAGCSLALREFNVKEVVHTIS